MRRGAPRKSKSPWASSETALRAQDLLSEAAMSVVVRALEVHREDIERGALLSIDEGGTRVRMLPLRAPSTEP